MARCASELRNLKAGEFIIDFAALLSRSADHRTHALLDGLGPSSGLVGNFRLYGVQPLFQFALPLPPPRQRCSRRLSCRQSRRQAFLGALENRPGRKFLIRKLRRHFLLQNSRLAAAIISKVSAPREIAANARRAASGFLLL
jgi:hypothetical protein